MCTHSFVCHVSILSPYILSGISSRTFQGLLTESCFQWLISKPWHQLNGAYIWVIPWNGLREIPEDYFTYKEKSCVCLYVYKHVLVHIHIETHINTTSALDVFEHLFWGGGQCIKLTLNIWNEYLSVFVKIWTPSITQWSVNKVFPGVSQCIGKGEGYRLVQSAVKYTLGDSSRFAWR